MFSTAYNYYLFLKKQVKELLVLRENFKQVDSFNSW